MPESPDEEKTQAAPKPEPVFFSRYRLIGELGRGGMSVVWRAEDTKLHREVALKFLPELVVRDREAMAELAAETRRCLDLTHPHIVRVYDLVEEGERAAISMELVNGPSLAERKLAQPDRCFNVEEIAPWIEQLCAALDYAHTKAHIVHRDLKPLNLLVNQDGDLKVVDFGISRSLIASTTRLTTAARASAFSRAYASPQHWMGEPPAVTDDIYSLGVTIYELLTSKPPMYGGDLPTQVREVIPPPMNARRAELGIKGRPPIPSRWEAAVAACLAKRAEGRPPSASDVAIRLGLATGKTVRSAADSRRRTRLVFAGAALVAIGALLALSVSWMARTSTKDLFSAAKKSVAPASPPVAVTPAPAAPAPEFIVTVTPPDVGARVWLGAQTDLAVPENGRLAVHDVPEGELPLSVYASGYQTYSARVVAKGGIGAADVKLVPIPAPVVITARPGTIVTAVDALGHERKVGVVPPGGTLRANDALTIGTYSFWLIHPDCDDAEQPGVTLAVGRVASVAPAQTPLPAELRVFSAPSGADVLVNGEKRGVTPATLPNQPSEKPLKLEVFLNGHRRVTQNLTLKPKETRSLDVGALVAESGMVELRRGGAEFRLARAAVKVDQRPANVNANGRLPGLEVGERVIEITHPDYEPWKQAVRVVDRQTTTVEVKLVPKPAILTLAVTGPSTFTLSANGKAIPVRNQRASVPSEEPVALEIAAKGFKTDRRTVKLAPRATESLAVTLEKISSPEPGHAWTVPELGLTLMPIAAGTFTMGSEAGDINERPLTEVKLTKPYWLGKTEVTQKEWAAVMGKNPSHVQGDNLPVENVSWLDAMEFCRKLTERERAAERLPAGYIYTLPSEAQWEYACRAGASGDAPVPVADIAWHETNSDKTTHPVGTKPPNAWGLHDMFGNVWEWCADSYAEKLKGGTLTDPKPGAAGAFRARRGGAFVTNTRYLRPSYRGRLEPENRAFNLGFRLALAPGS